MFYYRLIPAPKRTWFKSLPPVTTWLMAISLGLLLYTVVADSRISRQMARLEQRLAEIEARYVYRLAWENPELFRLPMDSLRQAIARGQVVPEEDPDFLVWLSYYQQHQELAQIRPLELLGFSRDRPGIWRLATSLLVFPVWWACLLNIAFLWLAGCNMERGAGGHLFGGSYLATGLAALLIHELAAGQPPAPVAAASGAVAGATGSLLAWNFMANRPGLINSGALLFVWISAQLAVSLLGPKHDLSFWAKASGLVLGAAIWATLRLLRWRRNTTLPVLGVWGQVINPNSDLAQAHRLLAAGDRSGARARLQQIVNRDQQCLEAYLLLARLAAEEGQRDIAGQGYSRALELLLDVGRYSKASEIYAEIHRNNYEGYLSERTMFSAADMLERGGKYQEAAVLYHLFVVQYPKAKVRPKALLRLYRLYRGHFQDEARAAKVLEQLRNEHPDFPAPEG